jgi:hypothetical protein
MNLVSSIKLLIGGFFFMSVGLSTAQEVGRFGKYENQLIMDHSSEFSTITTRPFKVGPLSGLDLNPLVIHAVDGKDLSNLGIFETSGFRDYTQTYLQVKIPAGPKRVVVRGGGFKTLKLTDIGFFTFEAQKKYIVAGVPGNGILHLAIYEYDEDERFSKLDPDRYVLIRKLTNSIPHGNLK